MDKLPDTLFVTDEDLCVCMADTDKLPIQDEHACDLRSNHWAHDMVTRFWKTFTTDEEREVLSSEESKEK